MTANVFRKNLNILRWGFGGFLQNLRWTDGYVASLHPRWDLLSYNHTWVHWLCSSFYFIKPTFICLFFCIFLLPIQFYVIQSTWRALLVGYQPPETELPSCWRGGGQKGMQTPKPAGTRGRTFACVASSWK